MSKMGIQEAEGDVTPQLGRPTKAQTRRALGYLLIGLGAPVLYAFGQFFVPSRHSHAIWEHWRHAERERLVFLIGALVGLTLVTAGTLVLFFNRQKDES